MPYYPGMERFIHVVACAKRAQQRGHQVEILDPLSCYMNVSPVASSIHYKGRQLPHFDAVIPRIGSAITYYGTAALRQFELLGSYPLNESVAITRARDKLRSLQLLARQGIDLPLTGIAHSPDDTSDLIAMVGGAPLVVKLVEGTRGSAWCWRRPVRRRRA